jgi:hypothetical protein
LSIYNSFHGERKNRVRDSKSGIALGELEKPVVFPVENP